MEHMANDDDFMTLGQVALALGNSEAWVTKLTRRGRLPYVVTPLGRLYRREGVERFLEARKEKWATHA